MNCKIFFKRFSKDKIRYVKSILLIGLSSIGDNLLITPAIKTIKSACQYATLDIVIGPRATAFALGNPIFSNVYIWEKKTGISGLKQMLANRKYDLIIDFRNSLIPFFLRTEYAITFFTRELFSRKFSTHEAVRILRFIEPYFGKSENIELYFPLKEEELDDYAKIFARIGISEPDRTIVLNPGAAFEKKRWDKNRFVDLGKYLLSRYEMKLVISGSTNEFALAEEIKENIKNRNCINLAGQITFRQLAYLLSRSQLLITNDTGTMHLASAMKCPVIAIFGPGNPQRYGPIGTDNIVLHTMRRCFPCRLEAKCDKNFVCMDDITVEDVISAVEKMLTDKPAIFT